MTRAATPANKNLRRLFILRIIAVVGQIIAIFIVTYVIGLRLPLTLMVPVLGFLTAFNFLTWLRLKNPAPVTDLELVGQLLADIVALAVLLYASGGSTNPFVSLFLLPLTIAAAILPPRQTWFIAGITVCCYTTLLFSYEPLVRKGMELHPLMAMEPGSPAHGGHAGYFELHVVGMWFNFLLSAVLIAYFVVRMAASIRERDRLLLTAREIALRDEHIIALGTLAAGAAHELGTPLATMAIITHELQQEHGNHNELNEDLRLLRLQIDSCKTILSKLLDTAGQTRSGSLAQVRSDQYLDELIEQWQIIRPGIALIRIENGLSPAPYIATEASLSHAIMNLLNNAADASPDYVEFITSWDERRLSIQICDRGPGLAPDTLASAGQPFFTTKAPGKGTGIGLFLANASIERFGGSVSLSNRAGGGARIEVLLPVLPAIGKNPHDG